VVEACLTRFLCRELTSEKISWPSDMSGILIIHPMVKLTMLAYCLENSRLEGWQHTVCIDYITIQYMFVKPAPTLASG
jgi:hypothetical protein